MARSATSLQLATASQKSMDCAAGYGHVAVLVWGAAQRPPILPTVEVLDAAINAGSLGAENTEVQAVHESLARGG